LFATAAAPDVKLLDIKIAEIYAIFYLSFVTIETLNSSSPMKYNKIVFKLYVSFMLWCISLLGLAIVSTGEFGSLPVDNLPLLRQPIYISIARAIQLAICINIIVVIIREYNWSDKSTEQILALYAIVGIISALYGSLSFLLLMLFRIDIGGAYTTIGGSVRACSLFVEGGPFGLYLLSALVVARLLFFLRSFNKVLRYFVYSAIVTGIFFSASKAALLALGVLIIFSRVLTKHFKGRRGSINSWILSVLGLILAVTLSIFYGLSNYLADYSNVLVEGTVESNSTSLVMGRIAGMVIVPNMIRQNPFAGIGLGNYPLFRNNPEYREFLPFVDEWDLDGLGLFGFMAEAGIPLTVCLIVLLFIPFIMIRKNRRWHHSTPAITLSICPLVLFIFGAQTSFIYPWIIYGMAISLSMS
jgi:hypothetical protein